MDEVWIVRGSDFGYDWVVAAYPTQELAEEDARTRPLPFPGAEYAALRLPVLPDIDLTYEAGVEETSGLG